MASGEVIMFWRSSDLARLFTKLKKNRKNMKTYRPNFNWIIPHTPGRVFPHTPGRIIYSAWVTELCRHKKRIVSYASVFLVHWPPVKLAQLAEAKISKMVWGMKNFQLSRGANLHKCLLYYSIWWEWWICTRREVKENIMLDKDWDEWKLPCFKKYSRRRRAGLKKLHEHFMCYCKNNVGELEGNISPAKTKPENQALSFCTT